MLSEIQFIITFHCDNTHTTIPPIDKMYKNGYISNAYRNDRVTKNYPVENQIEAKLANIEMELRKISISINTLMVNKTVCQCYERSIINQQPYNHYNNSHFVKDIMYPKNITNIKRMDRSSKYFAKKHVENEPKIEEKLKNDDIPKDKVEK